MRRAKKSDFKYNIVTLSDWLIGMLFQVNHVSKPLIIHIHITVYMYMCMHVYTVLHTLHLQLEMSINNVHSPSTVLVLFVL